MNLSVGDLSALFQQAFSKRLTVRRIQDEVAQFYGISPDYMRLQDNYRGNREQRISHPRQVAMFFARKMTAMSLPQIGDRFGGRDHTTVIHAIRAVEKRACNDPYLEMELEVLRERFSAQ